MICHKIPFISMCITFKICVTFVNKFVNGFDEYSLGHENEKWFSTIITFEIFLTFMNDLMCTLRRWEWENDFPQASHLKSFWSSWMVYKGFKKIQMWWIAITVAKISPNHLICKYIYELFMIWFCPNKFTEFEWTWSLKIFGWILDHNCNICGFFL